MAPLLGRLPGLLPGGQTTALRPVVLTPLPSSVSPAPGSLGARLPPVSRVLPAASVGAVVCSPRSAAPRGWARTQHTFAHRSRLLSRLHTPSQPRGTCWRDAQTAAAAPPGPGDGGPLAQVFGGGGRHGPSRPQRGRGRAGRGRVTVTVGPEPRSSARPGPPVRAGLQAAVPRTRQLPGRPVRPAAAPGWEASFTLPDPRQPSGPLSPEALGSPRGTPSPT